MSEIPSVRERTPSPGARASSSYRARTPSHETLEIPLLEKEHPLLMLEHLLNPSYEHLSVTKHKREHPLLCSDSSHRLGGLSTKLESLVDLPVSVSNGSFFLQSYFRFGPSGVFQQMKHNSIQGI